MMKLFCIDSLTVSRITITFATPLRPLSFKFFTYLNLREAEMKLDLPFDINNLEWKIPYANI